MIVVSNKSNILVIDGVVYYIQQAKQGYALFCSAFSGTVSGFYDTPEDLWEKVAQAIKRHEQYWVREHRLVVID